MLRSRLRNDALIVYNNNRTTATTGPHSTRVRARRFGLAKPQDELQHPLLVTTVCCPRPRSPSLASAIFILLASNGNDLAVDNTTHGPKPFVPALLRYLQMKLHLQHCAGTLQILGHVNLIKPGRQQEIIPRVLHPPPQWTPSLFTFPLPSHLLQRPPRNPRRTVSVDRDQVPEEGSGSIVLLRETRACAFAPI